MLDHFLPAGTEMFPWNIQLSELWLWTFCSSQQTGPGSRFRGIASPAVLCHKKTARRIQSSLLDNKGILGLDARVGSLWHKTAGASISREAFDQWEPSLDIPRPKRVDQSASDKDKTVMDHFPITEFANRPPSLSNWSASPQKRWCSCSLFLAKKFHTAHKPHYRHWCIF